ncbi:hypothetical protein BGX26_008621 [Mortierella sp. AD094]|nr:hypothetical protein BGX26_008621 [Mortierella sp. AD094]
MTTNNQPNQDNAARQDNSIGKRHPLDLPEIRNIIGQLLSPHCLVQCIQVSKAWHESYIPLLWSTIEFGTEHIKFPGVKELELNRHLVKDLSYHDEVSLQHIAVCYPSLRKVRFLHFHGCQERVATFISRHPLLSSITVSGLATELSPLFWESLLGLQNLVSLTMYGITVSRNNTHDFSRVLPKLEKLEIFDSSLSDLPEAPELFRNMQSLILSLETDLSLETQISWIAKHPQLKHLGWFPVLSFDARALDDLAHRAATGTWPKLQSLHLRSTASDKQVSLLITGMNQVLLLKVSSASFGPLSMSALQPHFTHLRKLDISRNALPSSAIIPRILASCPQLEHFNADRVLGQHIVEGQSWACEWSLTNLSICFELAPFPFAFAQQQDILRRISRLRYLENLDLSNYSRYEIQGTLDLRLEKGLAQLGTLKRLKKFQFYDTSQQMSLEEVNWIIENWKSLQLVNGMLNEDYEETDRLREKMYAAGIVAF